MLSIGDTIIMETLSDEREIYRAKVIDIKDDSFFIGPPLKEKTSRTEPIIIDNSSFEVQFVAKNEKVYKFQTEMLAKEVTPIVKFKFHLPPEQEFTHIQRRSFIRVQSQLKVKVFSFNHEFSPFDTYTKNISAGGLNIVLPERHALEEGLIIICSFVLPLADENVYLRQPCSIVRISKDNENQSASLQFEQMDERDRESLVRYCFEQQLAARKKGL